MFELKDKRLGMKAYICYVLRMESLVYVYGCLEKQVHQAKRDNVDNV